jgi:hypothetical protein
MQTRFQSSAYGTATARIKEDDGCKLGLSEKVDIQLFSYFIYVSFLIFPFSPINHKTLHVE